MTLKIYWTDQIEVKTHTFSIKAPCNLADICSSLIFNVRTINHFCTQILKSEVMNIQYDRLESKIKFLHYDCGNGELLKTLFHHTTFMTPFES